MPLDSASRTSAHLRYRVQQFGETQRLPRTMDCVRLRKVIQCHEAFPTSCAMECRDGRRTYSIKRRPKDSDVVGLYAFVFWRQAMNVGQVRVRCQAQEVGRTQVDLAITGNGLLTLISGEEWYIQIAGICNCVE